MKTKKDNFDVFQLAEMQLQSEIGNRIRKAYTMVDILDYAVIIRDYLIMQRTKKELANRRWAKV